MKKSNCFLVFVCVILINYINYCQDFKRSPTEPNEFHIGWQIGKYAPTAAGIQSAIDKAFAYESDSTKPVVVFAPGVYDLDSNFIRLKDGLVFKFNGQPKFTSKHIRGVMTDDSVFASVKFDGQYELENTSISTKLLELYNDSSEVINNGGGNGLPVESYGAVGDGVTDDFQAIQGCIDANSNVTIGKNRNDVYLVSQPLYLKSNSNYIINGTVKLVDGDSSSLTADLLAGDSVLTVADGTKFTVGQWVAVSDTGTIASWIYIREAWRGHTSKIESINGNQITLADPTYSVVKDYLVSKNAMLSYNQNVFIAQDVDNITITGNGLIDANRDNQKQIWGFMEDGSEEMRAGCGLTARNVSNFTIDGVEFRNGLLHNLTITGDETTPTNLNKNIKLNNVKAVNGHDKNILIRYSDGVWVTNCITDSATWEDGLIFYSFDTNCFVDNLTSRNNGRYGFAWNSDRNQYLNANNIKTFDNDDYGISITAKNANLSNLLMNDPLAITSAYDARDVNISNVTLQGVVGGNGFNDPAVLQIGNNIHRLNITNLNIQGCSGTAIYVVNALGANQEIKITGGGITEHSGRILDVEEGTNIKFGNFSGLEEILYNGDMEINGGWYAANSETGDTVQQSSTIKYSGGYSWYVSNNAPFEGIYSSDIYLDSNKVYEVNMWIYPVTQDSAIKIQDIFNQWQIDTTLSALTPNQWNKVSFKVTADSTGMDRISIVDGGMSGTYRTRFYIDDVSIRTPYNSGTVTINASDDSVIVTHGQPTTPFIEQIFVTPQSDLGGKSFYVDPAEITSTTFTIRTSATVSANTNFSWRIQR